MRSRRYARGRMAWGQDARTGERVLLRDLVRDGQTGLPVTRESYEPEHPQETPPDVFDPQVLRRPAPDRDRPAYHVSWPTAPFDELWRSYPALTINLSLAGVSIPSDGATEDVLGYGADTVSYGGDEVGY